MIRPLAIAISLALSGCGGIAVVETLQEHAGGAAVTVVPLTGAVVAEANRASYRPVQLPAVFYQNAGGGSALRGAGALPDPVVKEQTPPSFVETRLPPLGPEQPYEIGIGDVLVIATLQAASSIEELSGLLTSQNRRQGYTVQDDGAIAIPDVGRVQMAGLDLEEAEAAVFQALVENQLDPTFSIEVADFNSKRVTVGGAVAQSTVVPITLIPLKLQEALAAAGGPRVADSQFVTIRLYRDGTLYQVPLDDLPGTDVTLLAGDSIFVDTDYRLDRAQAYFAEQITLTNMRASARARAISELQSEIAIRRGALSEERSNFQARVTLGAVDRDHAYIVGEVVRQGRYALPFETKANLADALFDQAGGINPITANPSAVYLLRGNAAGDVTAYNLDMSNAANIVLATRMELRPNDIVFVSQRPVTSFNRVVQQLTTSLILATINELK